MKKNINFFIFILFLCVHIYVPAEEQKISWFTNVSKALEAAKKSERFIMIDVYTDWCHWCKELDTTTYTHPEVIKLAGTLVNVKINPEKDEDAAKFINAYPVEGYPTILFLDWNQTFIGKIGGYLEGKDFAQQAEKILSSPEKLTQLKKEHEKGNINSSKALLSLLIELEYQDQALAVIEELRLNNTLPREIEYYYTIAYAHLSHEYYHTALTLFDYILTRFKPGDNFEDQDYYYKSAYYKGFALSSLGMMDECKKLVDTFKADENNPYAQYFEGLLEEE
jgi:thioredoxin-related protein